MIFSDFSERRAVYNNIRITVPINIETKLYIKGELELSRPKPIPVFQISSKLINSFTKNALLLKLFNISIFEYLSKKKISKTNVNNKTRLIWSFYERYFQKASHGFK